MRGVFLIHKAYNENPEMMPAETVLEMATAKSARAIGAGSTLPKSGKLQPGFDADIITVRPELSTPLNENNIFDQVILYCNPEHVADVFVGGVQRKQDGVLLGYNAEEMRKEVRAEAARLWEGE